MNLGAWRRHDDTNERNPEQGFESPHEKIRHQ